MNDEPERAVTQAEATEARPDPGRSEPRPDDSEPTIDSSSGPPDSAEAPEASWETASEGTGGTETAAGRRRRRGSRGRGRRRSGGARATADGRSPEDQSGAADSGSGNGAADDTEDPPTTVSTRSRSSSGPRSRPRAPARARAIATAESSGDGRDQKEPSEDRSSGDGARGPADSDASAVGAARSAGVETAGAEGSEDGAGDQGTTTTAKRRRRRGSRGRGRARSGAASTPQGHGDANGDDDAVVTGESRAEPRTAPAKSRSRSGARPRTRATPAGDAAEAEAAGPATDVTSEAPAERTEAAPLSASAKRRRRRRRTGASATGETPAAEREAAQAEAPEAEKKPTAAQPKRTTATRTARRRTRAGAAGAAKETADGGPTRTRRSQATLRRRESMPVVPRGQDKLMLITEHGDRDQIAVVEDRQLVEHYITRSGAKSMVGNIYLGRVQNVLPGMEAAFIDIGKGRNAVLYAGEVSYDEDIGGRQQRIEQVLKPSQAALVQVTKDPIGGKGPRLTQEISVPGRYVVMVPNSDVFGISRRLPDNERRRLRTIIKKVRPEQHGVIVRTAAEGASEEDLAADLKRLAAEWEQISKKAKKAKAPHLLYEEPELTVRVVRDLFNDEEFKEIVTDTEPVYALVREYLAGVAPELVDKVRLHEGKLPLFEQYHLIEQIHKALERKVWLPSGGYLVIDKTEAMTVIDVNTGKHVGKANLEETVTKTNLEAAEEVARQLRLRDIGGMILVDFIDMLLEQNKREVIDTLKNAMARDKTRSQVFDISPLGILEITRKRVSGGLLDSFSETCPTCGGRGILITHEI